MSQLKQGDYVKLTGELRSSDGSEYLTKGTKGQILDINAEGYTVVFQEHIMPVSKLTDHDVELDNTNGCWRESLHLTRETL